MGSTINAPLGESGTVHVRSKVVKVAMPRKRRWVDGTNATVDDAQEVFFASKLSINVEILVKVQYEMGFMNLVGTHCGPRGKSQEVMRKTRCGGRDMFSWESQRIQCHLRIFEYILSFCRYLTFAPVVLLLLYSQINTHQS